MLEVYGDVSDCDIKFLVSKHPELERIREGVKRIFFCSHSSDDSLPLHRDFFRAFHTIFVSGTVNSVATQPESTQLRLDIVLGQVNLFYAVTLV